MAAPFRSRPHTFGLHRPVHVSVYIRQVHVGTSSFKGFNRFKAVGHHIGSITELFRLTQGHLLIHVLFSSVACATVSTARCAVSAQAVRGTAGSTSNGSCGK